MGREEERRNRLFLVHGFLFTFFFFVMRAQLVLAHGTFFIFFWLCFLSHPVGGASTRRQPSSSREIVGVGKG